MINYRKDECKLVCERYFNIEKAKQTPTPQNNICIEIKTQSENGLSDIDYINIGLNHDVVFRKYWEGRRPLGDESADDMALIGKLKFWANGNDVLIREMFLKSPHVQTKDKKHLDKLNRDDYLKRTMEKCNCNIYARTKDEEYKRRKQEEQENGGR